MRLIALAGLFSLVLFAQPAKLTFPASNGAVTFDHAAHMKRGKTCDTCHPKLFEKSAKAPLNYKSPVHRDAESKKISCGFCHRPGGMAFSAAGNCSKCHVKPAPAPK